MAGHVKIIISADLRLRLREHQEFTGNRTYVRDKKVVVVMPAYNAARTLRRTYDEGHGPGIVDLVIVVDDASRDENECHCSNAS